MGRAVIVALLAVAVLAGAALYYLQVYAYYRPVEYGQGALNEGLVTLQVEKDGEAVPLEVANFEGITSDSSPIRFRACFEVDPLDLNGTTSAPDAEPLVAPGWFDCFDARAIGRELSAGNMRAVLDPTELEYGVSRIIAYYKDGRAFAWHQLNRCGEAVYDGDPAPADCPPAPESLN